MKVKTSIISILLLLILASVADAAENIAIGNITTKSYDLGTGIPSNIFVYTSKPASDTEMRMTLAHNDSLNCLDISKPATYEGAAWICGMTPTTDQIITITYGIDRDSHLSNVYLYLPTSFVQLRMNTDGTYRVRSTYTNDLGANVDVDFSIPLDGIVDNKTTIKIITNETTRNTTVYYNDTLYVTTPYRTEDARYAPQPNVAAGVIWVEMYVPTGNMTWHVYNLTQEIPRKTVTTYPANNTMSIGLDAPRRNLTALGTALMAANGQKGTMWVDVQYLDADTIAYTNEKLNGGWELGAHFSTQLNYLGTAEAQALIDTEMETIKSIFGRYPSSYCSLQNQDNYTHAVYIYNKYGCESRNLVSGVTWADLMCCASNKTYPFWMNGSVAKMTLPVYTHHTDDISTISFSIDRDKFTNMSNAYASSGVKWVGWHEYFTMGQAQRLNVLIPMSNDAVFTYVLQNEYPVNVNVSSGLSGWVLKSRNGVTESIFNTVGNETFVEQTAGTYQIREIPFILSYDSGTVDTAISTWTTDSKTWTESSDVNQAVIHTIGDFPANTDIDIFRDGVDYDTVRSNSTGYITWVYDGGFSEHTFEAIPHATAGVRDSFVSSWGNTVSMVGAIIVIALAGSMIMMFRGKKDLSEVMNDLPGILLIVVLLVTGAIIFGQF